MGQVQSKKYDALVNIESGDRKGNTSLGVQFHLALYDDKGGQVGPFKQEHLRVDNDGSSKFALPKFSHKLQFGKLTKIEFWYDDDNNNFKWYIDMVWIHDLRHSKWMAFPVHRWIASEDHYEIYLFNTFLPDQDPQPELRQNELEDMKSLYEYEQLNSKLPVQIKRLPDEERYSWGDRYDLVSRAQAILDGAAHLRAIGPEEEWKDFLEIKSVLFQNQHLIPLPPTFDILHGEQSVHDLWFGWQRVSGPNPNLLTVCTSIPQKLPITNELIRPFVEHWSLKDVLESKRLFLVDFEIFEGIKTKSGIELPAPIGLFFRTNDHKIRPVAIQLRQNPHPTENPIFFPSDDVCTWLAVKMWFNYCDALYHQCITHIGLTHILMEGVCICTHRNLSPAHPVFRILMPHFKNILFLNITALESLVCQDGWFDQHTDIGRVGLYQLIIKWVQQFSLDQEGTLPQDLANRGMYSERVLKDYPWRNDGIPLWFSIRKYVSAVLKGFYSTSQLLEADVELQQWRYELTRPWKHGGVALRGIPGNESTFTNVDELIATITPILFISTVQHSNSLMNEDHYLYPPYFPLYLCDEPPASKNGMTLEDLMALIPDKDHTCQQTILSKIMSDGVNPSLPPTSSATTAAGASSSSYSTPSLLNFSGSYLHDPVSDGAFQRWQEELGSIERDIIARNKERTFPNIALLPSNIPATIDI